MRKNSTPLVATSIFNRYRWLLLAIALLLTGWLAYDMYSRSAQQLLWGYRPLLFFLLLLDILLLTVGPVLSKHPRNMRLLAASVGSGVLMGLGFPGYWVGFLGMMLIGWIPLLWIEDELSKWRPQGAGRQVFRYVLLSMLTWNVISTFWVANSALAAGLFAIIANSLLMTIPWVLYHHTKRRLPRLALPALVSYWFCFENLHYHWDLAWPWLALGNGFARTPELVQWYEYTGVFGGSLLIILLNWYGYRIWQAHRAKAPKRSLIWTWCALLVLPVVASLIRYSTYQPPVGEKVEFVVIQPNFEPHYEKFTIPFTTQVQDFLAESKKAVTPETDFLLFPETSFGVYPVDRLHEVNVMRRLMDFRDQFPGLHLITGITGYYEFKEGEPHTPAVRTQVRRGGDTIFYENYNAAVMLDNDGWSEAYKKSKLVPGPEVFPFRKLFAFMKPLVDQLGGTTAGLGRQDRRSVFDPEGARIGPAICYESVFGDYFTGYVKAGARAVVIMTNDGWWDDTPGRKQHLWMASLRAIETRRDIARSANTGISAFVNQRGDIVQQLPQHTSGHLVGEVQLNEKITFYVRWGDLMGRVAFFLAILLFLNTLARGRMAKEG